MNREDKRILEKEEEEKIRLDEMEIPMKKFRIRKINPLPRGNYICTYNFDATPKQKERLSNLIEDLGEKGIEVELPKSSEVLKKGEMWDTISKLISKRRQIERVSVV